MKDKLQIDMVVDASRLGEVAEDFISRMLAPVQDEEEFEKPLRASWWRGGGMIGLLIGLALGGVAFLIVERCWSVGGDQDRQGAGRTPVGSGVTQVSQLATGPAPAADPLARTVSSLAEPGQEGGPRPNPSEVAPLLAVPPKAGGLYRALLSRGWNFYGKADFRAAANVFEQALRLNPGKTDGYYGLAVCLFEQGQESAALRVLEQGAEESGPKAELWILAGSLYQSIGQERMARISYQRYLASNPRGAFAKEIRSILQREHMPRFSPINRSTGKEIEAGP